MGKINISFKMPRNKPNIRISYTLKILDFFFFFEKHTHTQGRGKEVLIQSHITTSLKSHGNF